MIDPRLKRLIIVIVFVLVVLGLAWLLYSVFFSASQPAVINNTVVNEPVINGLPQVGDDLNNRNADANNQQSDPGLVTPPDRQDTTLVKEVSNVVDSEIKGAVKVSSGDLNFYNQDEGKFYRYSNGELKQLTDKRFFEVDKVTWSNDGQKAVLEYPDGYNILYDFSRQKQVSLPSQMEDFSFNSNGEQLAAKVITDNPDNNWIVTSNYDGSGIKFVEHLGDKAKDVQINWSPAGEIVATYREGIDFERQKVYPIGQSGGNIKALTTDGRGFESKWSPDGDYILYSVYNGKSGYRPTLYISDMGGDTTGSNKIGLRINTWSDKCTFNKDGKKLYCAVPEELPQLAGIFRELSKDTKDNFYEIDLVTGSKKLVAIPGEAEVHATNISVSDDGDILYFVDEISGKLQKIIIK